MVNAIGTIGVSYSSSVSIPFKNFKMKMTRGNSTVRTCSISASAIVASDPFQTSGFIPMLLNLKSKNLSDNLLSIIIRMYVKETMTGVQFHLINEAYDIVMCQLSGESTKLAIETYNSHNEGAEEAETGMNNPNLDLWEEWMGWEGASIGDYSSHINPDL